MRKFWSVVISVVFILSGGWNCLQAQTTKASGGGQVVNKNQPKTPTNSKKKTLDISKVDFKNYTYPVPTAGFPEKTFRLQNGALVKPEGLPNFKLRKTYFFDLTGDGSDEAVTHISGDGCMLGCESSTLFFIHTPEEKQARLIWRIAIGGETMGGLKTARFNSAQIILEIFGDCVLEGWLIKPKVDVKTNPQLKTYNYTRFVFSASPGGFTLKSKDVLPLNQKINFTEYRPLISFDSKQ